MFLNFLFGCSTASDEQDKMPVHMVTPPCQPDLVVANQGPSALELRCSSEANALLKLSVTNMSETCEARVESMQFILKGVRPWDTLTDIRVVLERQDDMHVDGDPSNIAYETMTVTLVGGTTIAPRETADMTLSADIGCLDRDEHPYVLATWLREGFRSNARDITPNVNIIGYRHAILP